MKTSDQVDKLFPAIVAASGEMPHPKLDATNPHFRSEYTSLAEVIHAAKPTLAKHGLAVVQFPCDGEGGARGLTTRILHTSGQWIEGTVTIHLGKPDNPQALGSLITYLRRYALKAALGMADDDDDAQAATPPAKAFAKVNGKPGPTAKESMQLREGYISRLSTAKSMVEVNKLAQEIARARDGMTPVDLEAVVQHGHEIRKRFQDAEMSEEAI